MMPLVWDYHYKCHNSEYKNFKELLHYKTLILSLPHVDPCHQVEIMECCKCRHFPAVHICTHLAQGLRCANNFAAQLYLCLELLCLKFVIFFIFVTLMSMSIIQKPTHEIWKIPSLPSPFSKLKATFFLSPTRSASERRSSCWCCMNL